MSYKCSRQPSSSTADVGSDGVVGLQNLEINLWLVLQYFLPELEERVDTFCPAFRERTGTVTVKDGE